MKIRFIEIDNFRGIRHLRLEMGERMNVIVGENGAGKSTVLSALKYLLSWFSARMVSRDGKGISIKDEDVTVGADFCRLQIGVDNGVTWKLFRSAPGYREKMTERTELAELTNYTDQLQEEDQKAFPMVCHYGVNRAVADVKPLLAQKSRMAALDAYDGKLNNGSNFNRFFDWFREREDIENAELRNTGKLKEDNQLKAVKRALESILPGFNHFHVSREPRSFVLEKDGVQLSMEQLSDGEKCYLTLVGDIARLLAMTSPQSENPLEGEGCVLIDEVDLHLHPQWQSEVITRLSEIFPRCQFFVTTHSPFVVSNVKSFDDDRFILMRSGQAFVVDSNTYGLRVDEILTEFFRISSLRNRDVQQHIDTIWGQLAKRESESEAFVQSYEWLKSHLVPSDIEFVRINLERMRQKNLQG